MVLNRRVYYEHVMTIRIMAEYKENERNGGGIVGRLIHLQLGARPQSCTRAQRFQAPLRPQNMHLINQIPLCAL